MPSLRRRRAVRRLQRRLDVATRDGDYGRAVAACRRLAALDADPARWWWRLARLHEQQGDPVACRRATRRALVATGGPTPLDRRLLASSPYELRARRRIARFVRSDIAAIRRDAAAAHPPVGDGPRRLFAFWAQGVEDAPPVVRLCFEELRRRHGESELVLLDERSAAGWAPLPPQVIAAVGDDHTKRSDLLRLELLWRHGGVWVDATCLPMTDLLVTTSQLRGDGIFAFEYWPRRFSSWLIAAEPGDPAMSLLRAAFHRYWTHYEGPRHYFALHQVFEALVLVDPAFRGAWRSSPRPSADAPHALQRGWNEPYSEQRLHELLAGSWVHKLSTKYDAAAVAPGTLLHHLLTTGVPGLTVSPEGPADAR